MLSEQYEKILTELGEIKRLLAQQDIQLKTLLHLPNWLTQVKEIISQPSDRLLNLNFNTFVENEFHEKIQIGNKTVTVQYQTQIINNLTNRLDSSNFECAELRKVDEEFQKIYDVVAAQEKNELSDLARKIITEKATRETGFNEKLKRFGKRVATESLNIGTGVLTTFIAEYAKRLAGMG